MKPQYIAITGLGFLAFATAAFGVFGHYRKVNAEMFTNRGASPPNRGRAVSSSTAAGSITRHAATVDGCRTMKA